MLNAALAALNIGRVIALRPYTKDEYATGKPLDRTHATTDPKQIRAWWSGNAKHNIAVLLPPGIVCIDVDPEHMEAFQERTKKDPDAAPKDDPLPGTLTDSTPSAGLHMFYRLPAGMSCKSRVNMTDCEIFGTGGRVIAAGSYTKENAARKVSGGEYITIDPSPIAMAPKWVIEIVKANQPSIFTVPTAVDMTGDGFTKYGETALLGERAKVLSATAGNRNNTLNHAAFRLGQLVPYGDLTEAIITQHLMSATQGWPEPRKVAQTITKGITDGMKKPRAKTPQAQKKTDRAAVAEMRRLSELTFNKGKVDTGITATKGDHSKVLGLTVHAALNAILDIAEAANSLNIDVSQRRLAEAAHMGRRPAWKALHALQIAGLIVPVKQGKQMDAASYRLTVKGFLALQDSFKKESHTIQLKERPSSSSVSNVCDSLLKDFDVRQSGVFRHGALGRAAEYVAKCLATGSKTVAQIADETGLAYGTARRAVLKLVEAEMAEKSDRAYSIAPDFKAQLYGYLTTSVNRFGKTIIERDTTKRNEHHLHRRSWAATIEWRKQQRAQEDLDYAMMIYGPEIMQDFDAVIIPTMNTNRALNNLGRAKTEALHYELSAT